MKFAKFLKSVAAVLALASAAIATSADTLTYYHNDLQGSPVAITNSSGSVIWQADYKPFGDKTIVTNNTDSNVGYTGHAEDSDTGLTYMQARFYDPVVGRFYGVDPVGFTEQNAGSFNRYAYVNNNPYRYIDPDGEDAVSFQLEYNLPALLSALNIINGILGYSPIPQIPEGANLSANLSFPGYSEDGKWGAGASFNTVHGGEFGTEGAIKGKGFDKFLSLAKSLSSASFTAEIDYNWDKDSVIEVQNGISDPQLSAQIVRGGGQLTLNEEKELVGLGVKYGVGYNMGGILEVPIIGISYAEDEGFSFTGIATE